jgi:hypothetical protein
MVMVKKKGVKSPLNGLIPIYGILNISAVQHCTALYPGFKFAELWWYRRETAENPHRWTVRVREVERSDEGIFSLLSGLTIAFQSRFATTSVELA